MVTVTRRVTARPAVAGILIWRKDEGAVSAYPLGITPWRYGAASGIDHDHLPPFSCLSTGANFRCRLGTGLGFGRSKDVALSFSSYA
jgi:hypothetical protein